MSIALLGDVLGQARVHLNDEEATTWPDPKLYPKFKQAFNEMQAEMLLQGIPIANYDSLMITVPAFGTDNANVNLSVISGMPTNMVYPISIKERFPGQIYSDFIPMLEVDIIPFITKTDRLSYWSWANQLLTTRGATRDNEILLHFKGLMTIPSVNTDSTLIILGELYLAYKTASLAMFSSGNSEKGTELNAFALANLDRIIRMGVKQQQDLPAKRRPYHRARRGVMGGRYF